MLDKANCTDPWLRTLGMLSALSGDTQCADPECVTAVAQIQSCYRRPPVPGQRLKVRISVLDRPSSATVTLAWRDSTQCSYGDQVWHACRARVPGVCALSGRPIERGVAIYMPRPCRPAPLNASAMILRTAIDEAFDEACDE